MNDDEQRGPADLSPADRDQLRRAHQRLRNTSHALEALVATEPSRGRWPPEPAPPDVLEAATHDLHRAYVMLTRCHQELLGLGVPGPRQ